MAPAEPVNAAARRLALDTDLQEALRRLAVGALDSGRWRSGSVVDGAVTWVALVAPIGREVAQAVILPLSRAADPERLDGLAPGITPREREVLALSLQGRSPREIAADLGISWHTVRTHMKHAYRALGVSSRAEALSVVSDGEAPRIDVGLLGGDGARARAIRGHGNGG
ncbi:MAG: helix-turn-helix domain-containing protein [Planctomycetes bacterium]|nr:helix-turn-helix domain-containing protein [Planctomycetota bacterium]